jgi:hypothetical protein
MKRAELGRMVAVLPAKNENSLPSLTKKSSYRNIIFESQKKKFPPSLRIGGRMHHHRGFPIRPKFSSFRNNWKTNGSSRRRISRHLRKRKEAKNSEGPKSHVAK